MVFISHTVIYSALYMFNNKGLPRRKITWQTTFSLDLINSALHKWHTSKLFIGQCQQKRYKIHPAQDFTKHSCQVCQQLKLCLDYITNSLFFLCMLGQTYGKFHPENSMSLPPCSPDIQKFIQSRKHSVLRQRMVILGFFMKEANTAAWNGNNPCSFSEWFAVSIFLLQRLLLHWWQTIECCRWRGKNIFPAGMWRWLWKIKIKRAQSQNHK